MDDDTNYELLGVSITFDLDQLYIDVIMELKTLGCVVDVR